MPRDPRPSPGARRLLVNPGCAISPIDRNWPPRPHQNSWRQPPELGRTTLAIQARFTNLANGAHLLARDRSDDIRYGWRQANPRDVEPLLGGLVHATKALGSVSLAPVAPPHAREAIAKPAPGQVVDLRETLARRRADLGPLPSAAGSAPARTTDTAPSLDERITRVRARAGPGRCSCRRASPRR